MTKPDRQPRTLHDLLFDLARGGLLDKQTLPQIDEFLAKKSRSTNEPWFVKLLLFFQEGHEPHYRSARHGELKVAPSGESIMVSLRNSDLSPAGPP